MLPELTSSHVILLTLFINAFNAFTINVVIACEVFETVFLINIILEVLPTNTFKQLDCLPLIDFVVSASKYFN